jgi:BolA protein
MRKIRLDERNKKENLTMSQREQALRERLESSFCPTHLEIIDDSHKHAGHAGNVKGGGHFRVMIVSDKFAGLNTIKRHQAVYAALGEMMTSEIHALSISAKTPTEL